MPTSGTVFTYTNPSDNQVYVISAAALRPAEVLAQAAAEATAGLATRPRRPRGAAAVGARVAREDQGDQMRGFLRVALHLRIQRVWPDMFLGNGGCLAPQF